MERESNTGLIDMKQTVLIQSVIEEVGFNDGMVKEKFTPSYKRPLVKDSNGKPPIGMFRYSGVVGILLYLSGHTNPEIAFTVNCCAQYIFRPKRSHELALKRLARQLKYNQDYGILLDPNPDIFKIDAFPDAEFSGMYGRKNSDDPACAKSYTGFIITFADFPVYCISKLQT